MNRPEHSVELVLTTALHHAVQMGNEIISLRAALRAVHEECSTVGCEGPDDTICIESDRAIEDWCPWCRIGKELSKLNGTYLQLAIERQTDTKPTDSLWTGEFREKLPDHLVDQYARCKHCGHKRGEHPDKCSVFDCGCAAFVLSVKP